MNTSLLNYGSLRQTTPDQLVQRPRKKITIRDRSPLSLFDNTQTVTPTKHPEKRHNFSHLLKYETTSPYVFRQDQQSTKKIIKPPRSNIARGLTPIISSDCNRSKENKDYRVSPIDRIGKEGSFPSRGKKIISNDNLQCSFNKIFATNCKEKHQSQPTSNYRRKNTTLPQDNMWQLLTFDAKDNFSPHRFHKNINRSPIKNNQTYFSNMKKQQYRTEF